MTSSAAADRLPDPDWTFGDRLLKARKRHGATQRDFATALDVKHPTYAAWEADRTSCPRESAIAKRVEVLTGTRAAWLLGVTDSGPVPPDGPAHNAGRGATTRKYSTREQVGVVTSLQVTHGRRRADRVPIPA